MTTDNPTVPQHCPEPWEVGGTYRHFDSKDWFSIVFSPLKNGKPHHPRACEALGMKKEEAIANAARIVACVNACRGIPTAALEAGAVADLLRTLTDLTEEMRRYPVKRDVRKDFSLMVRERAALDALRKATPRPGA